jgi:hypothetical protein
VLVWFYTLDSKMNASLIGGNIFHPYKKKNRRLVVFIVILLGLQLFDIMDIKQVGQVAGYDNERDY